MPRVHANPDDLDDLARRLSAARENVRALNAELNGVLKSMDWHDAVRDRIARDIESATRGMSRFADNLDDHSREVRRKSSQLRTFLER